MPGIAVITEEAIEGNYKNTFHRRVVEDELVR